MTNIFFLMYKKSGRPSSEPDPNSPKGKKRAETKPNVEARYDGYAHYPGQDDKKEATRCKMEKCGGKSRTFCTKCHVHLCLQKNRNCFLQFHNK
jgi:hypothetical protein